MKNIPLGSAEIALYRAVLAVLMLGGYFLAKGEKLPLGKIKRELPILFLSGAAMGMNWIFLFEAYKYTTVSIATLSYYFAPLIVTVLCPLLFHEKLTIKQMICFLMSTVGVVLIIGVSSRGGSSDEKGIFLGLTAACLYASVILLNKCVKTVTGIERTFLQFMAAMFVLFLYTAFNGGFHLDMLTAFGWGNLLVVGLFHTGITYCLYFSSMRNLLDRKWRC